LNETDAAVDVISLLRPTVAVAWFVDFAAVPLECHLVRRRKLRATTGVATAAEDGWGTGGVLSRLNRWRIQHKGDDDERDRRKCLR
jgi:hypothetical protein